MKKPTFFEFISYEFKPNERGIFFNYKQEFSEGDAINFTERITLPKDVDVKHMPAGLLEKLLQGMHLIIGTSYYKFYCATKIKHSYSLSKKEAEFWNTIYKNGLGEFYYRNNLDPKKSPKFSFDKNAKEQVYSLERNSKYLVALSGGKDSIVASELLKEQGLDITAIFTETGKQSDLVDKVAKEMGVNLLKIQRGLDQQVFQKHKYDGHIPISAVYAFLGIFYAVLYNTIQ